MLLVLLSYALVSLSQEPCVQLFMVPLALLYRSCSSANSTKGNYTSISYDNDTGGYDDRSKDKYATVPQNNGTTGYGDYSGSDNTSGSKSPKDIYQVM